MKKILGIIVVAAMALSVFGCSSSEQSNNESVKQGNASSQEIQQPTQSTPKAAEPLNLVGEWEQSNKNSQTSYQSAIITDTTIEVYWVAPDTKSLYWAGSYKAPTETTENYSWDSENDTSKTESALLASGDTTKKFSYSNGEISYEVTALGVTTTVRLAKK
jgi:hypothetical protein